MTSLTTALVSLVLAASSPSASAVTTPVSDGPDDGDPIFSFDARTGTDEGVHPVEGVGQTRLFDVG